MKRIDRLNRYKQEFTYREDPETTRDNADQEALFRKYVELEQADGYRQELREAFLRGGGLTGPKGLRKKLAAVDLEYFGRAYLGHYFTRPAPDFHRELDRIWQKGVMKGLNPLESRGKINTLKGCRKGIAAPRGHAKSTTFTFKDALHAVLYEYKHYIMLLSDSSDQAEGFLGEIKVELEENQVIREDFGDLKGRKWTDGTCVTATDIKIDAIGSGKKVRGRKHRNWRPDLIILDDVENDENVNTPEQRKKLANWYYKAVSKAGDPTYTDIVYIGTLLHYDSLLAKVLRNSSYDCVKYKAIISEAKRQDLWEIWESLYNDLDNPDRKEQAEAFYQKHEHDMMTGVEVLWPETAGYYALRVMRLTEGEASFNSEYQNEPVDPDNAVFNEEWFDFYSEAEINFSEGRYCLVGAVDPSLGKNKRSDTSAIIALIKDTLTGYLYVWDASIEKRHPDAIINDAIEGQRRAKREIGKQYVAFGVETNQFQYFFKDVLAQKSAAAQEYLAIEEIQNTANKDLRIRSLQPYIKNKYLKFSQRHKTLLRQLKNYPMDANDDGPDGLEMAVRLAAGISGDGAAGYRSVLKRVLKFGKGAY